jgi:DNA-binding response OmpR family regulator
MNKKILVVDDDPSILEVINLILSENNYDVCTSPDGHVFENLKCAPDLIVLDVLLSGEDGRDIIKKLRKDKITHDIPVVMYSAHPSAGAQVKKLGANDFIAKPFEIEDFLKVVKKNIV